MSAYSVAVLADNPHTYYRFGDLSGTSVTDSSGNGNTGTYINTPALGAASLCNDSTDYSMGCGLTTTGATGSFAKTANLPVMTTFTVEGLFYGTPLQGQQVYFSTGPNGGATGFMVRFNSETEYAVTFNAGAGSPLGALAGNGMIMRGKHHIALTWEGNGLNVNFYVNGGLMKSWAAVGPYVAGTSVVWIGADTSATNDSWHGFIDEYAQYSTALSAARIRAHANAAGL